MIPHEEFISSRAKPFSAKSGPVAVLSRPEAQERDPQSAGQPVAIFISAETVKWPDAADGEFHMIPRKEFISGRAKPFLAKSGPAKWPDP